MSNVKAICPELRGPWLSRTLAPVAVPPDDGLAEGLREAAGVGLGRLLGGAVGSSDASTVSPGMRTRTQPTWIWSGR